MKKKPQSYRKRTYRGMIAPTNLASSFVTVQETDLQILAPSRVEDSAHNAVRRYRNQLENYIARHPDFLTSLSPLPKDDLAPAIIKDMLTAAKTAQVGPMAAVAGAIAEFVGRDLLAEGGDEIIVENGGDIFMQRKESCVVAIFAGQSPLNERVGVKIPAASMPMGICTSSGTIGHSLSLGKADSVTILSRSTSLADAVATSLGNTIKSEKNIDAALQHAQTIPGINGAIIILNTKLGVWGDFELIKL